MKGARPGTRLLPLEGGRNFRDLGGYPAGDGRTVRWGQVYRSGAMTNLTDADYRYLSGIGLRVVCDFRCNEERLDEPARWSTLPAIDYCAWDYSREDRRDGRPGLTASLRQPGLTPEKVRVIALESYDDILERHKERFREVFRRLAEGDLPLVFNCSAGKDRTGVAAALLLTALGVARDIVVQDYALSDQLVDFEAEFLKANLSEAAWKDELSAWAAGSPVDLLRPLLRSDPEYIERAFAYLDKVYDGAMGYIQNELGIDDGALGRLQDRLLARAEGHAVECPPSSN